MNHAAHEELPDDLGPWVVVANITKKERGGPDPNKSYFGTRIFAPGAKVYIGSMDGGMFENFGVIGKNRVSKKLSASIVNIKALENFRPKVIYKPGVLQKLLWTQFMEYVSDSDAPKRNRDAGFMCLLKNKEECENLILALEKELELSALNRF